MGVQNKSIPGGAGPPLFRIQGKLVHRIGKLIPDEGDDAKCGQMWFYSSFIDGTAGYFSEQFPAESECATNMDDFFNNPLQIARLQHLLGCQEMSFG